ncbi:MULTISPECIES: RluA family pseudouridine synthase [Streptococcus]|uniref:Pseudouridine synthase n=4 Tax=Bacteria TaxID=2 RepID=A0ABD6RRH1_STROR|nr:MULTISPECIES: RluA family pseudouridine synthase [Streptococcus]ATF55938.1 pseudouridine synthase [Streptococcus oralis]MCB7108059.1 RluA family pseudouridine synthase [Streptococcus oralis]MCC3187344.1 RluA family pseudouridine synthase [Streptococcus oralis]MCP8922923.1 RluA family pseudouridine synthase [Streptococcus oralis]MCQ5169858.1 RluA family pseudouridine synthase [Streptococcus oralis]
MQFTFTLPSSLPQMTVKELLEEQLLIPRKIRHFLRTKKNILINQKQVHWNEIVKPGDICQLTFDEEDYPPKEILWGNLDLVQEIYQDQHLIIVNKPEGMKTHGNQPGEIALLNHVSAYVGQNCYVVHRLDMETSGLVLFAKNPFILPILNRLLEKKDIAREYWALVEGQVGSKELVFRDKIGRDRHDRRKRIVDEKNGQYAETHISRLKQFPNKTTLVRCKLKTGRTHQIRVHLSHHKHPILGDPLYNSKSRTSRLMLHAFRLSFTHPLTLEKLSFTALSDTFEIELKQNG